MTNKPISVFQYFPPPCLTLLAASDWLNRESVSSVLITLTGWSCWVAVSWPATPPESISTISNCSFSSFFLNYKSQVKDGVQCWKLSYPLNLNHLLHLANDLFCQITIICLYFRLKFKWDGFFNLFTLKCVEDQSCQVGGRGVRGNYQCYVVC